MLLSNKNFKEKVNELFAIVFLPIIDRLINSDIRRKYSELEKAMHLNKIRWGSYYEVVRNSHRPVVCTVDELTEYLKNRTDFLKTVFVEGRNYHLIQLTYNYGLNGQYMCFSVEDGFPFNHSCSLDDYELSSSFHWIDRNTGVDFDPSQIVTQDRQFVLKGNN